MRNLSPHCAAAAACAALFAGCNRPQSDVPAPPAPASPISFTDARAASGLEFSLAQDLTRDLGIKETNGHPAALLDADGDGLLDVLLAGPDRVTLFRNLGGWKFHPVADAGFRQPGFWQGVAVGDVDNDGRPDLFLSGYGCAALYLNAGSGRFRDVTAGSGLGAGLPGRWGTSAAFADVDRDGRLDLYVTRYLDLKNETGICLYPGNVRSACGPSEFPPQKGSLYRNQGGGRFTDATHSFGLDAATGKGLGVSAGDVNGDGYPDLYLANDKVACDLFLNQGGKRFTNAGFRSGTAYGPDGFVQGGMGVDFGDYNNDGRDDLVVTTFQREPTSLYRAEGGLLFSNEAFSSHLGAPTSNMVGYGAKWIDLDNDGLLDLALANGHPLHRIHEIDPSTDFPQRFQFFRNTDGATFEELTTLGSGLPRAVVGRALCTGDLDNDGHTDVLISDIQGQPLLLRNETHLPNHWFTVRLASRRSCEGATVTVRAGKQKWVRRSTTGGSYLSASDPRVHFGLKDAAAVDELEIRWPWGGLTRQAGLPVDRILTVKAPE